MSGTLKVDDILKHAEAIFLQLRDCRDLPPEIHDVLSLSSPNCDKPFASALPSEDLPSSERSSPCASRHRSPVHSNGNHVTQTLHSGESYHNVVNKSPSGATANNTNDLTPADDSSIEVLSEAI
jgi:hypothetical protein